MENLAAQPEVILKSFEPLASVDMMMFDLKKFGHILPETRNRVQDEELSYLSEGIDRASHTSFELRREGNELVYFDNGNWRPYTGMLLMGLEVARREAQQDNRREFLVGKANNDLLNGYKMRDLKPGQKMFWYSAYPHKEAAIYGYEFMKSVGFKPERKMGFLYSASCNDEGNVVLESQTIDRSDGDALEATMRVLEYDTEADIDTLTRVYDGILAEKYSGHFFAGRREAEIGENAWKEILEQKELVQYLLNGLETIAKSQLPRHELETAAKKHVYGVWATFRKLIDGKIRLTRSEPIGTMGPISTAMYFARLEQEVQLAYNEFSERGEALVGCGGVVQTGSGPKSILDARGSEVFSSIFGNRNSNSVSEKYSFDKKMFCVGCQAPPSETERKNNTKKMCGPCGLCRSCDKKLGGKG